MTLRNSDRGLPLFATGAVQPTRYVGAIAAGAAPASGTFAAGDFIVVLTGGIIVCTVAGTPGGWVNVSQVGNGYGVTSRTVIQTGTVTYTPPAGTLAFLPQCLAAGGGGGGCTSAAVSGAAGGGGGGGAYAEAFLLASVVGSGPFTVAVGAGGLAGANSGGNGGDGGDTTFGAAPIVRAKGGGGGIGDTAGTTLVYSLGGPGGAFSTGIGDVVLRGCPGFAGITNTGLIGYAGNGGNGTGPYGGGGGPGGNTGGVGVSGGNYGGGGSGALVLNNSGAVIGGVGANGLIVVWEFA